MNTPSNRKILFLLLVILFVAFFVRLWQLESIPPGLYPDEAMNGVNALEAIDNNDYKVFYPENNGREGLFINIQAESIKLFGNTPIALRLVSTIFGALTIGAVFILLWLIFQNTRIAFISSLLMALSFWHINFSRIGFRAITMPFFLVLALIFLVVALRNFGKPFASNLSFIFSGIALGLGLHGYTPFRLMPLLFISIFFVLLIRKEYNFKVLLWRFCLLGIACVLVFSPLVLHFMQTPNDFSNRHNKIYFFQQEEPLKVLFDTTKKYLLMFNFVGDCNSRHNYDCKPQLNYIAGIFFLIGLIGICFKGVRNYLQSKYLWILPLGLFFTLLPGILASEGAPHALRTIGVIPFAFAFAGIGIEIIYQKIIQRKLILTGLIFAILVIIAMSIGPYDYFINWPKTNPDFSQNYLEESYFLKQFPDYQKFIVVNVSTGVEEQGFPTTIMTSKYILWQELRNNTLTYLHPSEIDKIKDFQKSVIVLMENDQNLTDQITRILKEKEPIIYNGGFTAFVVDNNKD